MDTQPLKQVKDQKPNEPVGWLPAWKLNSEHLGFRLPVARVANSNSSQWRTAVQVGQGVLLELKNPEPWG